jgi:hypothetical protein
VSGRHATTAQLARFFSRVSIAADGCWLWTGCVNGKGYAAFDSNGAHRYAYQWFVGPIPEKFEIDHLCRVRRCVNPAHLEAVSGLVNRLRGTGYPYRFGACRRGHDLAVVGLSRNARDGEVFCRECRRISQARYRVRRSKPLGSVLRRALLDESLRLSRESRRKAVAS